MGLMTHLLSFVVTLTWLAAYWTGTAWAPMEAGHVVYKVVNKTDWIVSPLNHWGVYRASVPVGSVVLWAVNANDAQHCVVADPPTARGPANMGADENVTGAVTHCVRFTGDCKP